MRKSIILFICFALIGSLAFLSYTLCSGQKIRERDTQSERQSVTTKIGDNSIQVDVSGDGDSTVTRKHVRIGWGPHGSGTDAVIDRDSNAIMIRPHRSHGSSSGDDIVKIGEGYTVKADEVAAGDVVSIGGDVIVLGHVSGDVVSIGGNVSLEDGAVVAGDAVSIGGVVKRAVGSKIGGENVGIHIIPSGVFRFWNPASHFPFFNLLGLLLQIAEFILLLLVGWLLSVTCQPRLRVMGNWVEERMWRSLLTGFAIQILAPAAFLLLLITIVGIPAAALLPVAILVAMLIGHEVVAAVVGQRILKPSESDPYGWLKSVAVGLVVFKAVAILGRLLRMAGVVLGLLGWTVVIFSWAIVCISATIGLGALVLSRFGRRQARQTDAGAAPQSPGIEPISS